MSKTLNNLDLQPQTPRPRTPEGVLTGQSCSPVVCRTRTQEQRTGARALTRMLMNAHSRGNAGADKDASSEISKPGITVKTGEINKH